MYNAKVKKCKKKFELRYTCYYSRLCINSELKKSHISNYGIYKIENIFQFTCFATKCLHSSDIQ